jgi:hypothetical protein
MNMTGQENIDLYSEFSLLMNDFQAPNIIKTKLLTDAFSKHNFYVTLPFEISKLYSQSVINQEKLIKLSFYSYLYFSSILCFDKYYDSQIDVVKNKDLIKTYLFFIKEHALIGLLSLINQKSEFWTEFNKLKFVFFEASSNDNLIESDDFNDAIFFENAKSKSILSHAYIYSLKYLFGKIGEEKTILTGLDKFHIGFQIYDDYTDLKEDKLNNQLNYFYCKIKQKTSLELEHKSFEYLLKLSYIDNTITECLELALVNLKESQKIFSEIKLDYLLTKVNETIYLIESELYFIKASIIKATDKSIRSNVLIVGNNAQSAIDSALNYLKTNLNDSCFWIDFLTNAGYGKEWVTGYVLSMIGEIDTSITFLNKPLNSLLASQGGYNNQIVQDGDSSNFLIKTSTIFSKDISKDRLENWLAFSNSNGGWSTYFDNGIKKSMKLPLDSDFTGWFSPQICVTAVAAWVAKDFKDETISKVYDKTVKYIMSNQNNDGSWNSYWWTENIYATAFALLSIPKNEENTDVISKAISYLLQKQNSNGSWNNVGIESSFYTALALKALIDFKMYFNKSALQPLIKKGVEWLIDNQMNDGSWKVSRILQLPSPEITNPNDVKKWGHTSFGLNCLVDDHNRIFTTSTVYNCLCLYGK